MRALPSCMLPQYSKPVAGSSCSTKYPSLRLAAALQMVMQGKEDAQKAMLAASQGSCRAQSPLRQQCWH